MTGEIWDIFAKRVLFVCIVQSFCGIMCENLKGGHGLLASSADVQG